MGSKSSETTPVQNIKHERFTAKQGYQLWYLSLDLSGYIAVSGFNYNGRTFLDLYSGNSDSREKLELFYSNEFEKYSNCLPHRYASFLDKNGSKLVTCIGDQIEIIDAKNESKVLRSGRLNGNSMCLAVREGEIFVGLAGSQTVLVFNNDLKETKNIRIKGIQDGCYPWDLQVIKDTIFVCIRWYGKAISLGAYEGSIALEYTDTTRMCDNAYSIAVSEKLGFLSVLWNRGRIIVYSLDKIKSFLVFDVDYDVHRIRVSDRDRMLITGNFSTGEIKMYDLENLFSFEAMKRTLAYIVSPEECEELRKYFRVTEEEMRLQAGKKNAAKRMECLLTIIEEKGYLNPYNINTLTDAVSSLGDESRVSSLKGPMEGYSLHGILKVKNKKLVTEVMTKQETWEDERYQLSSKLEAARKKVKEHAKTVDELHCELVCVATQAQEQTKTLKKDIKHGELRIKELEGEKMTLTEELQESCKRLETLSKELEQIQMKSAKEIKTLTENLETSKTESERLIQTLTEELKHTKHSKTDSDRKIETLTEELKQAKQSKTESERQREELIEELTQVKRESSEKKETLTEQLQQNMQSSDLTKKELTNKIETLTTELNETKRKLRSRFKDLEKSNNDLKLTKQNLKQTTQDRDNTRTELRQYQLDFAKESKALKEVLNQAKEAMTELQKRSVEDETLLDLEETGDESGAILAAEFGRLTVAIAEQLTLDHCLKLATLLDVPTSDCFTVLRVSWTESPGMKFLDVLKKRKVINMYDVSNLQKALAMLSLEAINHDLVAPYQGKIDRKQYELYKTEDMFTRKEVNAVKYESTQHQIRDSQTSHDGDTVSEYASQEEVADQHAGAEKEGRGLPSRGRHHHRLYTEQNIGREGGTIRLADVSLTVPPDALHESHVIALSVMNESPFPLDREVDTARMTPLIKLEPLGLMFKKSLQLSIPHSALITEHDNHDVIIYSGQVTTNNGDSSDYIIWTEDKSTPRQLKEKSVTVHIQCLTYLSASLVSQTSAPPLYIVRAVPFVDGVRNPDDDIILTICFCRDNEAEYNMLLSDYNTKLPLEQYSTIQLYRHPEKNEDDAGFLSVIATSCNNTYVPDADQTVKTFSLSHLCTASRVSHQLKLQKNKGIDRDDVQIMLTFSQTESKSTKLFMKTRIKDLMISQESENLLLGSVSTALKPYEELKANISPMLENYHCIKLATYFDLTPAEVERVQIDESPGRILMKILDEREKIMPLKMFGLYQGLKVCHLDKIARLVFEYIEKNSNETHQEKHKNEKSKCVKGIMRYLLPVFVDAILQSQRGVFMLPRRLKN